MGSSGYQVNLANPDCVLRSGTNPYWHLDFTNLLRNVNSVQSVSEVVFPNPIAEPGFTGVSFALTDIEGNEVLKHSYSLKEKAIPARCLKKLQAAIDQLHIWADDPRVPQEKRAFCKKFVLPDPKKDPEAYRLSGGMFSRKLHVLWGYQKEGSEAFLPASKVSEKWDDASMRKSIFTECRGSLLRRVFRMRNIVLLALVAAGVYFGAFFPAKCPTHQCVIGKGVMCLFDYEAKCPKRCALPDCNRHLDSKEKCNAHKCKKCGKMQPTSNGQDGVCDECFWILK